VIENSLLAAVSRKEYRRLLAGLEPVTLTFSEVLYEPGETIRHVYFPGASLVSLLTAACPCYEVVKDVHDGAQVGHAMPRMRISAAA